MQSQDEDKLATLDIKRSLSVELEFNSIDKSFNAHINSPMEANTAKLVEYFEKNPSADSVKATFDLYINDEVQQSKSITFIFNIPEAGDTQPKFYKTAGLYEKTQSQQLGEGKMLYNIGISTQLNKTNEFFIYDTPDVNLAFATLKAFYTQGGGEFYGQPFLSEGSNTHIGEGSESSRMEVRLYDIYYRTDDPGKPSKPRQASYHEQTLYLDRYDVINQKQGLESLEPATVHKDILVEKLHREELLEEEKR